MASYHRVLESFGRSIQDKTLECDCDIHPWELAINDEQWAGKIRFIGFIDVFFLICYSANARFEHGIIVYKDKLALFEELTGISKSAPERSENDDSDDGTADHEPEQDLTELVAAGDDANLVAPNAKKTPGEGPQRTDVSQPKQQTQSNGDQKDEAVIPEVRNTSTFSIKSLGHPIGLRASYPKSWIRSYKVEITKPASWGLSKRIIRGLKVHSTYDLMGDVIRCGLITQGQLVGHVMGVLLAGSRLDDTTKKYLSGLTSGNDAGRQALSNEKI